MFDSVADELKLIWKEVPEFLSKLLIALLILILGILILRLGRRLIRKTYDTVSKRRGANTRGETVRSLFLSLFNILMYFAIIVAALSVMGVDVKALLTVAGFSGFALVFGCQTLIKDIISGMFLWIEGSCNVGDVVTVAGQTGRIENVALRSTTLRATNGAVYVIPNGEIRTVVNMSSDYRCAVVDISIAHGPDYARALEVLKAAMADVNREFTFIDEDPVVEGYISADRGAATCRIECRCSVDKCWDLERGIRLRALEALEAAGIKH